MTQNEFRKFVEHFFFECVTQSTSKKENKVNVNVRDTFVLRRFVVPFYSTYHTRFFILFKLIFNVQNEREREKKMK